MGAIEPLGDVRIAKADEISATTDSIYAVAKEIDQSNECLNDLNAGLKLLQEKHELYKIKADRARSMMRKLSTEL